MHSHQTSAQWFSLLELILVIMIISILFLASSRLFSTPNKHLIDSEACINTVHGQINNFFFQSISGKDQLSWGITYEPNYYQLHITSTNTGNTAIHFNIATGENNNYVTVNTLHMTTWASSISSCRQDNYIVLLSWTDISATSGVYITIAKWLDTNSSTPWMSICTDTSQINCKSTTFIDYRTCLQNTSWIQMDTCKHMFAQRFDTRTQTLKSNRCLNTSYTTSCTQRSIDPTTFYQP